MYHRFLKFSFLDPVDNGGVTEGGIGITLDRYYELIQFWGKFKEQFSFTT